MKGSAPLIIAIVLGFVAMLAVYTVMKEQQEKTKQVMVEVAMAKTTIPTGSLLRRTHFSWYEIPKSIYDRLEEEFISRTEIDEFLDKQTVRRTVPENSFILKSHFISTTGVGSSAVVERLSSGQRALSLSIGYVEGLSGLLRVGDHVDIIGVFEITVKGYGNYQVSTYLLTDVPILALDNYTQVAFNPEGKQIQQYTSVTVRVKTPEDALFLVHSQTMAQKLYLVLRRKDDTSPVEVKPIDNMKLMEKTDMRIKDHPAIRESWNW